MKQIRCFLAAELPEPVLDDLASLRARLEKSGVVARWAAREALHLTIKFFGETDEFLFQELIDAFASPLGIECSANLGVRGLGAFPDLKRPRVLWAGLEGDVSILAKTAMQVEQRSEALGLPRETRPFKPHLTLARAKGGRSGGGVIKGLGGAMKKEADYEGPKFEINELILFESILQPQGPQHIKRASVKLGQ